MKPPTTWRAGGEGGSGIPPEENRRRQDSKLQNLYNRTRSAFNRNFGHITEYGDFASAVYYGKGALGLTTTYLAMNEAVDRLYGARAKWLRESVYKQHWYTLPVGIDTLSRLFPH